MFPSRCCRIAVSALLSFWIPGAPRADSREPRIGAGRLALLQLYQWADDLPHHAVIPRIADDLQILDGSSGKAPPSAAIALPTVYDEDRFYVRPQVPDGQAIKFFTDTGGGYGLYEDVAKRLGLSIHPSEEMNGYEADLPGFVSSAWIPYSKLWVGRIRIFQLDDDGSKFMRSLWEGMLGAEWFADGVWIFDYPARRLYYANLSTPQGGAAKVRLGFKEEAGRRTFHFPRIEIEVDGEVLDMLFDTGATSILSDEALRAIDDGRPTIRASSFITRSQFLKWRNRHPDWKVIERGERYIGTPLILVPEIKVAGHTAGPAWFAVREDANFHEWMSQWMDKKIEGAVGGNVFRNFRITVDYPNALAYFE